MHAILVGAARIGDHARVHTRPTITEGLLHSAADHATRYLEALDARPVRPTVSADAMRAAFATGLDAEPVHPQQVLDDLVSTAEPGLMAYNSPRFFGWVIGGTLPAALAADWLTAAWDQPAGLAEPSPAAAACEHVAGDWMRELLGLPAESSFALVTGCQMAHVTALAAARHRVLADAGWDVEEDGLLGAPAIRVLA